MLKQQIMQFLIPTQRHMDKHPHQTFGWHDPETDPNLPAYLQWSNELNLPLCNLEDFLFDHGYEPETQGHWNLWTEDTIDQLISEGKLHE